MNIVSISLTINFNKTSRTAKISGLTTMKYLCIKEMDITKISNHLDQKKD